MGCCFKKPQQNQTEDQTEKQKLVQPTLEQAIKSPIKKKPKPVNVFKPGARDVRIVTTENGTFEKTKYVPPSDPEAALHQGAAISLVTASLLATQKEQQNNKAQPTVESFKTQEFLTNNFDGGQLSFEPKPLLSKENPQPGYSETFGEENAFKPAAVTATYTNGEQEGSYTMTNSYLGVSTNDQKGYDI